MEKIEGIDLGSVVTAAKAQRLEQNRARMQTRISGLLADRSRVEHAIEVQQKALDENKAVLAGADEVLAQIEGGNWTAIPETEYPFSYKLQYVGDAAGCCASGISEVRGR